MKKELFGLPLKHITVHNSKIEGFSGENVTT